jgi:hypothetical protein
MNVNTVWQQILSVVRPQVPSPIFHAWFRPVVFLTDDGTTLSLQVPSDLFRAWFEERYAPIVQEALATIGRSDTRLILRLPDGDGLLLDPVQMRLARLERKIDWIVEHISSGD